MLELEADVHEFFNRLKGGAVEIYNEFSLQHEVDGYLRTVIPQGTCRVQFERPSNFFGIPSHQLLKKEIDIAIFSQDHVYKAAIELKFPRNGQYPEQMFSACKDVAFLEQLVDRGFNLGLFVMAAEDRLFYEGAYAGGIYSHFRSGTPICGQIQKPTGTKDQSFAVRGLYILNWHKPTDSEIRYSCISVIPQTAGIPATSKLIGVDA